MQAGQFGYDWALEQLRQQQALVLPALEPTRAGGDAAALEAVKGGCPCWCLLQTVGMPDNLTSCLPVCPLCVAGGRAAVQRKYNHTDGVVGFQLDVYPRGHAPDSHDQWLAIHASFSINYTMVRHCAAVAAAVVS